MSDVSWFYAVGSEQRGPIAEAAMPQLIDRGEIGPETLVWREGMDNWSAARSSLPGNLVPQSWVDGLSAGVAPPPVANGEPAGADVSYSYADAGSYHHPIQFVDVIKTVFSRYVRFQGRARRSEYWYWILFIVLVSIALAFVDGLIFGFDVDDGAALGPLFSLGTFLPSLAVGFRRMHDIGKSAWWLLLGFIPIIGTIILIIWFARRGDEGDNQYGPA